MRTATKQRIAWSALMVFLLFLTGAAGGLIYGGRVVPPGSGLAGPAIVLGYGVLMAAGGLVVGLTLGLRAKLSWMPRISAAIALVTLVTMLFFILDVRQRRAERDARREASGSAEQFDRRPLPSPTTVPAAEEPAPIPDN